MKNKITLWLANIFYYGLFLSTMLMVTWLMLRPGEGGLWSAFRASNLPERDLILNIFFSFYFLTSAIILLYGGIRKKLGITMNEFVRGFVLWLIAIALMLILASKAFSSISVGMD